MEFIIFLLNLLIVIGWISRFFSNRSVEKDNQRILEGIAQGTQAEPHRTITEQEQHVINELFNFPYDEDFGVREVSGEAHAEQSGDDVLVFINDVAVLILTPSLAEAVQAEGTNIIEVMKLRGQDLPVALSVNYQAHLSNALEELEIDHAQDDASATVDAVSTDTSDTHPVISQDSAQDSAQAAEEATPPSRQLGKRELSDTESNLLTKRLEAWTFCLPTLIAALVIMTIGHSREMSFSLLYTLLALSGIAIAASGVLFYLAKRPVKMSGEVIRIQATVMEVSNLGDRLLVEMPGLNGVQRLRLTADKRWLHHLPCGVANHFEYHSPSHTLLQVRNTHLDGLGAPPAAQDKAKYQYLAGGLLGLAFGVATLVSWPQLETNGLVVSLDQQLTIGDDDSWPDSMPIGLQLALAQPRKCVDPLENSSNAQVFCQRSVVDPAHEYQTMTPEIAAVAELIDTKTFRPEPNREQRSHLRFLEMQATITGQRFSASDVNYYWEGRDLHQAVIRLNQWCELSLDECQTIKEGLITLYPKLSGHSCGDDNAACWQHMSELSEQSYDEFKHIYLRLPYSSTVVGNFLSNILNKFTHTQFADYPTASNPEGHNGTETKGAENSTEVTLHYLSNAPQADTARKRINDDRMGRLRNFTSWYNHMLEMFEAYQRQPLHGVVIDYQNHDGNIELWLDGDLSVEHASKQLALASLVLLSLLIAAWAGWRVYAEGQANIPVR
ncbi:hypothetical protein [Aliagarivorans marinus]|uniref:hypothetical protein n=1 Tax=Aliagarivorans marinus TaxID=561965 RepID=UPI0003FC76C2|nr:hypothetical protein [Aliagarivorans marinus]